MRWPCPRATTPAASYPAILAIPGGEMTPDGARRLIESLFEAEAARAGYLVFAPAAQWGGERPFIGMYADDTLLPQFMDAMVSQYAVEGTRFHLAGFSAGAEALFRSAVRVPGRYRSLTAMSGYAGDPEDLARLDRLAGLPVAMFVGEGDIYVAPGMEEVRDRLEAAGIEVHYEVVAESWHRLEALRTPAGQARLWGFVTRDRAE